MAVRDSTPDHYAPPIPPPYAKPITYPRDLDRVCDDARDRYRARRLDLDGPSGVQQGQ